MRILIIDDSKDKAEAIKAEINRTLGPDHLCSVSSIDTMPTAVRLLSTISFDLLILDLMLPYVEGGDADSRAGLELLRQMRTSSGPNKNAPVLALSAFPDEVSSYRTSFDQLGVLITTFDEGGSWRHALLSIVEGIKGRPSAIEVDFLIVCALEEERQGYSKFVREASSSIVSGLNVQYVRPIAQPELLGALVRLSQMGLVAATFETANALGVFRTPIVGMSGICAGFKSRTELGQLVVASPAWEYQAGKWSKDGFEIAPHQVPLRSRTRPLIDHLIGTNNFKNQLESALDRGDVRPRRLPDPVLAPFATGSAVIADQKRLEHITKQHRKIAAIDMETYGLYYSANEAVQVDHFFSVKSVVDYADDEKTDDFHRYGSCVSACAAIHMVSSLLKGESESTQLAAAS